MTQFTEGRNQQQLWKVTVRDDFFKRELTGNFEAETEAAAIEEAREFYAEELDDFPENINVVNVVKVIVIE